jgi:L-alanine-DL-glutamate epimerase-like enolase superfamily enzyme
MIAIDIALWDLKAKLLDVSLSALLGRVRDRVAIYGIGGFTSYSDEQLQRQFAGWVECDGCSWVKMKIGGDPPRIKIAHATIGDRRLFVDANGAFTAKAALALVELLPEHEVEWFEEPVSSDDLAGLDLMRARAPASMDIAAGETGYNLDDFHRLIASPSVDVLQADLTRCGGISGFLRVGALCESRHVDRHLRLGLHSRPCIDDHSLRAGRRCRQRRSIWPSALSPS